MWRPSHANAQNVIQMTASFLSLYIDLSRGRSLRSALHPRADHYSCCTLIIIFCLLYREQIEGMVRNFISREADILKIYKIQIKPPIEYYNSRLVFGVETWKLEYNIEIVGHTKNSEKNNKKCKRLQLQEEIEEIRINRKKQESWSNWNFQNKVICNYGWHFFQYFFLNWKLTVKTDFKD